MNTASQGTIERPTTFMNPSETSLADEYARVGAWGLLASIDLHGCDRALITDPEAIKRYVVELTDLIGMQRHGPCYVERFGEGDLEGWSMFQFIETSCVSAHFDEKLSNNAYIDIFSCKYFEPAVAAKFSREFFKAGDANLTYLLRK